MTKKHFHITWLLLTLSMLVSPVFAADKERDALAKILREITVINQLLDVAEVNKNPDQRITFEYDYLRNDLEQIKLGIRQYMTDDLSMPKTIPALSGDYRR
jgi:RAQPRD family integrative conjugative element protein